MDQLRSPEDCWLQWNWGSAGYGGIRIPPWGIHLPPMLQRWGQQVLNQSPWTKSSLLGCLAGFVWRAFFDLKRKQERNTVKKQPLASPTSSPSEAWRKGKSRCCLYVYGTPPYLSHERYLATQKHKDLLLWPRDFGSFSNSLASLDSLFDQFDLHKDCHIGENAKCIQVSGCLALVGRHSNSLARWNPAVSKTSDQLTSSSIAKASCHVDWS